MFQSVIYVHIDFICFGWIYVFQSVTIVIISLAQIPESFANGSPFIMAPMSFGQTLCLQIVFLFSGSTRFPGPSYTFLALVAAISPKSLGSFLWRIVFRNCSLGDGGTHLYQVLSWFVSLSLRSSRLICVDRSQNSLLVTAE